MGLSMASGEYIYFMDSDDYLDENALEQIVSTAEKDNADVVYGKKVWTWFRRSLFLRKLYEAQEEEEEDDSDDEGYGDKEGDSSESEQDSADSDGRPLQDSSVVDEESEKDTEQEEEDTSALSEEELIASKKKRAYYELVSRRKSLRSITVLHVLMRRRLIEENHISFNEEIIFLSDYPFMLQVLDKARIFSRNMDSQYIKRNHNDAINYPSLNQMKESKNFTEYIKTYEYARTLIAPDSDLRRRLDKKIIYYTIRYFAPNLKRKKKSPETLRRFNICTA